MYGITEMNSTKHIKFFQLT